MLVSQARDISAIDKILQKKGIEEFEERLAIKNTSEHYENERMLKERDRDLEFKRRELEITSRKNKEELAIINKKLELQRTSRNVSRTVNDIEEGNEESPLLRVNIF